MSLPETPQIGEMTLKLESIHRDIPCVYCERPLAEHAVTLRLAERPRTVCQGLVSGFKPSGVQPAEHQSATKTEPPPRVLVCLNLVELESDNRPEEVVRFECRGCDNWTVAQGRAERGQGFCSKLGAFMNSDDFCSLYEDPK